MPSFVALSRIATTFKKSGEIDEDAYRKWVQRFVDAKVGVYAGSGGSGEGHALTLSELSRLYKIAVECCKGKVPVAANPPEQHTARQAIEQTMVAVEAGVEVVNLYGPTTNHGYRPTDQELIDYHDRVLSQVKHPIALAPNPVVGYTPKASLVAGIAKKYKQVVAINLASLSDSYFLQLKALLDRDIALNVPLNCVPNTLMLGAAGMIGGDLNITPKTFRRYLDLCEQGKYAETGELYSQLRRSVAYMRDSRWYPSTPRGLKLAMHVLKLPGWEGGLREPYGMPPEKDFEIFKEGLLRLRVPEIEELARAAGLTIPA